MTGGAEPGPDVLLETSRLRLRPWRVAEAAFQREMWLERDPQVPPHRRIDADGHPTVTDIEESIRAAGPSSARLLVVERKGEGAGSRRVLSKLGFTESESKEAIYGINLLTTRPL
jgi:hypothetical protein